MFASSVFEIYVRHGAVRLGIRLLLLVLLRRDKITLSRIVVLHGTLNGVHERKFLIAGVVGDVEVSFVGIGDDRGVITIITGSKYDIVEDFHFFVFLRGFKQRGL